MATEEIKIVVSATGAGETAQQFDQVRAKAKQVADTADTVSQSLGSRLKASLKSLREEAAELLNNKLFQGIGLAGLIGGLQKTWQSADELDGSLRALAATAKLSGVPLADLQAIADKAQKQFGLSTVQANDFATELAKLAGKAGDVGKAGPALQSFLDIGAAKGLNATETLTAVKQSILGIDEGTDKLFNKNPSVIYGEFATSIGTTAGKLTDQQKAQALLNAAMDDGSVVRGTYSEWLGSAAGKQQLLANATFDASAEFGHATSSMRDLLLPALTKAANGVSGFIKVVQSLGAIVGGVFFSLAGLMSNTASTIWKFVTGDFKGAAASARAIVGDFKNTMAGTAMNLEEIWSKSEKNITATVTDEGRKRVTQTVQDAEARKKKIEETQKAIDKALLESANLAIKASVSSTEYVMGRLNDHGAAAKRLKEKLDELKQSTDAQAKADEDGGAKAQTHAEKVRDQAGRIKDLADRLGDVAYGAGLIDEKARVAVGAIGDLGKAFTDVVTGASTGDLLSGITGVIGAMGAIARSLFGGNQELRDQLAKNSVRLEQLRTTMGDLLATQLPGRVVDAIGRLDPSKMSGWTDGSRPHGQRQTNFMKMLKDAGLTMADIDQLAKDWSVPIRAADGSINLEAVAGLIKFVRDESDTAMPNNFQGQKRRIETGKSIGSITDPLGEAVAMVTDTANVGSPAIRDALAGLGLDTKDGRGQAIANLRALYNKAAAGKLQRSDFGGMSQSDFFDAIQWLIDMFSAAGASNIQTPDTPGTSRNPDGGLATGSQGGSGGGPDVGPNGGSGISASIGADAGVSFSAPAAGLEWMDVITNVWTPSRDYLRDIRDTLAVARPAGAAAIGAPSVQFSGDIVIHAPGGADVTEVRAAVDQAMDARLDQLDEALAQRYFQALSRIGSAVRSS